MKRNWSKVKAIAMIILGGFLVLNSISLSFDLYPQVVAKLKIDSIPRVIGFVLGYGLVGVLFCIFGAKLIRSGLKNIKSQKTA